MTVGADIGVGIGMKVLEETEDFGGNAGALTDKPERPAVDIIVGLEEVYEASVDWDMEFEGTAENLAEGEDLIGSTAGLAESRLVLKNSSLHALRDTSKEDTGIDLSGDRKEADSPVAVTLKTTALIFEGRDNDAALPVLR